MFVLFVYDQNYRHPTKTQLCAKYDLFVENRSCASWLLAKSGFEVTATDSQVCCY